MKDRTAAEVGALLLYLVAVAAGVVVATGNTIATLNLDTPLELVGVGIAALSAGVFLERL